MLRFDQNGIYCPPLDSYIDPWRPVKNAIITHAHADHARTGSQFYLSHIDSVPVLKHRLGSDIQIQSVEYNEIINKNGVKLSLHPAGHIVGSAQIRIEYQGQVWVVSGDYKLKNDNLSTPFEPIKCHHFVTESTFGLPVYKFPEPATVYNEINEWWRQNKAEGKASIILGYSLGKSQNILKNIDPTIGPIFTHGAIENINELMRNNGHKLPRTTKTANLAKETPFTGSLIIAPPSVIGTSWLKRFFPYSIGLCSGWMHLRGTRRRKGVDRGFVLSDHADWTDLNDAVTATGAENIYVTHGYKTVYAQWLRSIKGLNAQEVDTLYEGESIDKVSEAELREDEP